MSQADQFAKLGTAANETIRGRWQFSYCGGAAPGTDSCSTNNGNVMHQVISPLGMTQSYSYDEVNRLKTVVEQSSLSSSPSCTGATGESPCRKFKYDRWGNMGVEAAVRFSTDLFTPAPTQFNPFNQTTVNGAEYDAAGNQKKIGGYSRAYDAENRMVSSTLAGVTNTFAYDGEGRRVKKDSAVYVYDAQGRLAAEYGGSSTSVGTYYLTQDHLGSTRLVTDSAGAVAADGRHDYLPFGEQITAPINGRDAAGRGYPSIENATTIGKLPKLFTGKERDAETGLDFFEARYFSGAQGRFTSPDPLYIDAKRLLDPQSLNLYAYVRNNPLKFVDPDGMDFVLNCNGSQENCQQTVNDINNRKGGQFKVELGKNNKLQVVKGSIGKNLSANESALLGAVNDTNTTATINVLGKDSSFNFEKYDGNGQNSIDRADLNVLGGANKELPGEVISHAMMESYSSAQNESGYLPAHQFANRFFGRVLIDTDNVYPIPRGGATVTGIDTAYRFGRNGMDVSVIRTFDTPIPLVTLRQMRTPPPGQVTSVTPIR